MSFKPLTVVKDMGLTPDQFFQDIGRAMRGFDYRIDGYRVTAGQPEEGLTIDLRPLAPRRLSGLLSLPRCEVAISFHGFDRRQQEAFLAQFDLAFQRGGG